ncbi:MAG: winged helix DNA-binding domain-containing protein [Luteimonas sp.]|nr:winged helix DNA-binding domain-containing protein [Luteimonas sp.]
MAAVPVLDTLRLNRALLARQWLLARKRKPVRAAVRALGGLQSQEPRDPHVALWSRIAGFRGELLHEAATRREIVRGSYLRCTLHTVDADDFVDFRALLQPAIERIPANQRALVGGFDGPALEAQARALLSCGPLTAQQVAAQLLPRFPDAQKAGIAYWVRSRLVLAIVPGDDARWGYARPPRFVPARQWLGRAPRQDTPLAALLLRGLAAIGPASAADLRTWSGLAGIGPALASLRPQLRGFRDEAGRALFDLPDAPRPRSDTPAPVRLLPEYDNALLSHADRARIQPPRHARHFVAANGRRPGAVLVDGFVRGCWRNASERDAAAIEVRLFEKMASAATDDVAAEAEALLRMLEPGAATHVVRIVPVR